MEVPFAPEIEARLQQVAFRNGKNPVQLVQAAAMRVLDDEARFTAAVERGMEQADRGEFVEHQEVLQRIERLFQS